MGFFVVNFDGGIIGIMLPTLQKIFRAEFYQVQWVWLAGLLTIVVTLAIAGRLGDLLGKRPMFAAGGALYAMGSVLITVAPTIGLVAVCRVVQALGVTIFRPLARRSSQRASRSAKGGWR